MHVYVNTWLILPWMAASTRSDQSMQALLMDPQLICQVPITAGQTKAMSVKILTQGNNTITY